MDDPYAYWNTPDSTGVTRRQRKWAEKVGVNAALDVLAALPCLGGFADGWSGLHQRLVRDLRGSCPVAPLTRS
jgi:hypothetical protein